ncbi:unnamed protein product [Parascedosporium putredinis]|uniref:Uncharacterized protein n=1 Tax=Parascedosporium putredinis TaxID=1442378 RepID=A0A9P1H6C6_9PEZI|nr:unnamed protein product [Parascedosporium putredinis]CAI7997498.1 unnamed protein product [Parascedosporium putredinis]
MTLLSHNAIPSALSKEKQLSLQTLLSGPPTVLERMVIIDLEITEKAILDGVSQRLEEQVRFLRNWERSWQELDKDQNVGGGSTSCRTRSTN